MTNARPWKSEDEFWVSARIFLRDIWRIRFRLTTAASSSADEKMHQFCQKLRASPHLILARIQREHHATDSAVVLVLHVATLSCGVQPNTNSLGDGLLLAFGCNPPRQIAAMDMIRSARGFGRLFIIRAGHLYPSRLLIQALQGGAWPDWQVDEYKRAVAELPEKGSAPIVGDDLPCDVHHSRRARAARRATPG